MEQFVPFGEFLPDQPATNNPGANSIINAIPRARSYGPVKDLAAQSTALDARARGAIAATDTAGDTYLYAADATKIYEIRDNTATQVGSGYTTADDDGWEFTEYNETLIGTNFTSPVQSSAIGTGSWTTHIQTPSTLSDQPRAKHIGVIRDFLVLGNIQSNTDGILPNRVQWSALGDSTDFVVSATTQADYQDIVDGGAIQRIVGGAEYGIIMQETQIKRMSYAGSPTIFNFSAIDRQRGTHVPNSVVGLGRHVFFYSEQGFMRNDGTGESVPIGDQKIDRFVDSQFDPANAARVTSAVDFKNKMIVWGLPLASNADAAILLGYQWNIGRWTRIDAAVQILFNAKTQGYTLEQLDSVSSSIDDMTESLDSSVWQGGEVQFAAFDPDNKYATFTGENMQATLQTSEVQFVNGRQAFLESARPIFEGGGNGTGLVPQLRIRQRNSLGDDSNILSLDFPNDLIFSMNTYGEFPLRHLARYFKLELVMPAGMTWDDAQGIEARIQQAGRY